MSKKLKMKTILSWRVADAPVDSPVLDSPSRVLELLGEIRNADREHFVVFVLSARSKCIAQETVSVGTLSASLVHPREVFKAAIMANAAAIIVAHNHPSGDHTPSAEDKDATRRLQKAGELLGIPLLDHLVVSSTGFYSFKDMGNL